MQNSQPLATTPDAHTEPDPVPCFRKIVVARNYTQGSEQVLERACLLSNQLNAATTIVHAIDPDTPQSEMAIRREIIASQMNQAFFESTTRPELLIEAFPFHADDEVYGRAEIVGRIVRERQGDLILTGPHRNTDLFRRIRGTMTLQLLSRDDAPVLICANTDVRPYTNVFVATDLLGGHTRKAQSVASLAPEADITLMHLPPAGDRPATPANAYGAIGRFLAGIECPHVVANLRQRYDAGRLHAVLDWSGLSQKKLAKKIAGENPDLLVFATRADLGLDRLVLGSVAEPFITRPPCDVLAVRKSD